MILKRNRRYWAVGIELRWDGHNKGWDGRIDFYDDGFLDADADTRRVSTEGAVHTRNTVRDGNLATGLSVVIDVLIADADTLGISLGANGERPRLYYQGDGEHADAVPPADWRQLLRTEAERIGWATHDYEPPWHAWAVWGEEPLQLVGMTCGYLLKTFEDALARLADSPGDLAWIRGHRHLEEVDAERGQALVNALLGWKELTESEKAALRPAAGRARNASAQEPGAAVGLDDDYCDAELATHAGPRGHRRKGDPITACGLPDEYDAEYTITVDMASVSCTDCLKVLAPKVHLHSSEWTWRNGRQVSYTACGITNPKEPVTVDLDRVTCAACLAEGS